MALGPIGEADSGQICAVLTFDMLANTLNGVTFPTTVTFFAAKSMVKDVTPDHLITDTKILSNVKCKTKFNIKNGP